MKRRALLALSLTAFCLVAHAADLAAQVRERLAQPAVLRGSFEQSKAVAGFSKPLVSKGDFLVAKAQGVVWRTRSPFASQLRLTRDEIVATQGDATAFRLNAAQEPSVRVINGLLFALLNGDVSGLSELFKVEGEVQGRQWHLQLTPRSAAVGKLMRKVVLSGDQFVRSITLDEASGDQTQIRMSAQQTEPATLSAEELARFN